MGMNIWQSALSGLVSGFTELMPLSADAHRALLRNLMGIGGEDPVFRLVCHMAAFAALFLFCRREIDALRRAGRLMKIPARRRRREPDALDGATVRHFKTAALIAGFLRLFTSGFSYIADELQILAFSVIGSGILLLIPGFVRNGNKDARNMLRADSMLMALASGLSVIPGFSAVGGALAAGVARGVDRRYALRFSWLLMLVVLGVSIVFDIPAAFAGGSGIGAVSLLTGALTALIGSFVGCRTMKKLILSTNCSGLGYYCLGLGIMLFVLFLTV